MPPPEPMGGLFKCKILHQDQEPVIETQTVEKEKQAAGDRQRTREALVNGKREHEKINK